MVALDHDAINADSREIWPKIVEIRQAKVLWSRDICRLDSGTPQLLQIQRDSIATIELAELLGLSESECHSEMSLRV